MQRIWLTHPALLVEMLNGTASLKNSLAVSYKAKHATTIRFSNCALVHLFQTNADLCSHKNLSMNVDSSFIGVAHDWPRAGALY